MKGYKVEESEESEEAETRCREIESVHSALHYEKYDLKLLYVFIITAN